MSGLPPGVRDSDLDDAPVNWHAQELDKAVDQIKAAREAMLKAQDYVADDDIDRIDVMRDVLLEIQGRIEKRVEADEAEMPEPFDEYTG